MKGINGEKVREQLRTSVWNRLLLLLRWLLFSAITGAVIGLLGTVFGLAVNEATSLRTAHPWLILGLPLAGILIVWMYQWEREDEKSSTNLVLDAIHAEKEIPIKTAPLIFFSTVLTHLFGGSAGREGAALQLGGSVGNFLGICFHFDENDKRIVIMSGMSAAFSALFGTPLAAAIFSMEVASVGIMHYAVLLPCAVSSYIACAIAKLCHLEAEQFPIENIPELTLWNGGRILLLGLACAAVSILFCVILHKTEELFQKYLKNPYWRAFTAGCLLLLMTGLLGTTDYLGAGMHVVERSIGGTCVWWAFLMKMLFTAVTLGGGYKGGEIVPAFFVGAAFGCTLGPLLNLPPSLCAACGMTAVFCGVTNCPLASLLISFELFGFEGSPFFLLAIAVSYMQSGYYGLYHSQRIVYSKTRTEFISRNTKE